MKDKLEEMKTNQELKEKLLEEFDVNFFGYVYPKDCAFGDDKFYDDITSWLSTKLEALLLSEDEVTTSIYLNTMYSMSLSRTKAKAIIKNQRDKLNKESV